MPRYFAPLSGADSRQVLQRAVVSGPDGTAALYLRSRPGGTTGTDTYMNLFHRARWRQVTGLCDFALEAAGRNAGLVRLFYLNGSAQPVLCGEGRLTPETPGLTLSVPAEAEFCFFDWRPDDPAAAFPRAEYTAERRGREDGLQVALVTTTFERVADLTRTVAAYEQACARFREIADLSHLYVVNNQPADAAALAPVASGRVTLINNPENTGGAGGFDRGAREAVAAGRYSHVLFMDDDIIIHEEAWFRTLALLRNVSPRYADQVVSGGMFVREAPTFCHTLSEYVNRDGSVRSRLPGRDLSALEDVLEFIRSTDVDAGFPKAARIPPEAPARPCSAWWYCVIPIQNFQTFGFPLPVFFRGDDIEYSLRLGRKVIPLNGVCVWHPSFGGKGSGSSPLRRYLSSRNYAIYDTLHCPGWKKSVGLHFMRRLAGDLSANNYSLAAATVLALFDYMDFARRPGPGPETITRLNAWCAFFPNEVVGESPGPAAPPPAARPGGAGALFMALATLGGSLIPGPCFKAGPAAAEPGRSKGRFPAKYVLSPHDGRLYAFNRRRAFRLSLKGLRGLAAFFLFGGRIRENLRAFARRRAGACFQNPDQ